MLETELGLTQSSIYNAFGSKSELMARAIERYNHKLDDAVVARLEQATAIDAVVDFVDDVLEWISHPEHPGCLLLNTLGQLGSSDPNVVAAAGAYRMRVRNVLASALVPAGASEAPRRAELILGGLMGMNISAYGGAGRDELEALAESLKTQLREWVAAAA